MTDQRLRDAIEVAIVDSDEYVTLEQIFESVQAQISGKLTESRRRQIRDILHSHRQRGLIRRNDRGRYEPGPGAFKGGGLFIYCGTPDLLTYGFLKRSVSCFISYKKGEAFTLRDVCGFRRFYNDAVRNRYMIKKFIDELCEDGQLESVRPRTYRATANFEEVPETNSHFTLLKHLLESRRELKRYGAAMADKRLLDAIGATLIDSDGPLTLEQIFESVQAQISGKLTESRRRQIRGILHSHRRDGLIIKTGQDRYEAGPDVFKDEAGLYVYHDTPYDLKYGYLKQSVVYFISCREGEAFALRDVYDLERFYNDAVRNRYMIKKFIDELCEDGQLELVGPQRYRTTANFKAGQKPQNGSHTRPGWTKDLIKSLDSINYKLDPSNDHSWLRKVGGDAALFSAQRRKPEPGVSP